MEIKKFTLFENNQTNGNTYGMGNVGAPQPKSPKDDEKRVPQPEPKVEKPKDEETPKNESVRSFSNFHLNEEGVVTAGNTTGMGNVSAPPVSLNGMTHTYTGDGSPTSNPTGSGDRVATALPTSTKKPALRDKKRKPYRFEKIISFNDFF